MSDRKVAIEDRGFWWSAASRPHPALRPFLDSYVGYWEEAGGPSGMRTLPTRSAVVIINMGPPLHLATPDPGFPARAFGSFVAGMHNGPGRYDHPGRQRGIQLDLTPLGAYTLFGVAMHELTNIAVELGDLLGPAAETFVERLAETPGWAARFDLLDALLLRRLDIGPSPAPEVSRAWDLLSGTDGRITVTELAGEIGWSRKHLVNRFREQVGLPPKVMGRVLRFHRALDLMTHGVPSWVDVAVTCGYYDQAHLNREFRALAGCTPTELIAAQAPAQLTTTAHEPV